jgi:hypothetical protein
MWRPTARRHVRRHRLLDAGAERGPGAGVAHAENAGAGLVAALAGAVGHNNLGSGPRPGLSSSSLDLPASAAMIGDPDCPPGETPVSSTLSGDSRPLLLSE